MSPSEPTAFDWWSGIVLPAVFGFGSLFLAGAALVIAVLALRDTRKASADAARAARVAEGRELSRLAYAAAELVSTGLVTDTFHEVLASPGDYAMTHRAGAASIASQLAHWLIYVRQYQPEEPLRTKIVLDIMQHVQTGIAEYVVSDDPAWRLKQRTAQDIAND